MGFNLRPFGDILSNLLYNDIIYVLRLTSSENEYGATIPDVREVIYEDVKSKFSFSSIDGPADANEANIPILKRVNIHVSLDYDIVAGDYIFGYRKDQASGIEQLISGICGEPNRFDTHQEIPIQLNEEN